MKVTISMGMDDVAFISVEGDTLVESAPEEIAKVYKAIKKELNKEEQK